MSERQLDILPPEIARWQYVEERARSVLDAFAFREIRAAGALADVYLAHRPWTREPVTRWYRLAGAIDGAVFGLAGASGEAELVALLVALAAAEGAPAPRVEVASRAEGLEQRLAALGVDPARTPVLEARLDDQVHARFELSLPGRGQPLAHGERRDDLLPTLGAPAIPALIFRVETAALVATLAEPAQSFEPTLALFVATTGGPAAASRALPLAHRLRLAGIRTEVEHRPDVPLESQRARAQALRARLVLVVGPSGELRLEEVASGGAEGVAEDGVVEVVRRRMD